MTRWTDEQREAISVRDKNLLVSAAAGSGKTAVLTERIIKLITEDRVSLENMLIVTFTNAAAGEMRERILSKLIDCLLIKDVDDKFIRAQIAIVNKSFIITVHSFCIDIVRKNFFKLSLDPNFKIGDPVELNLTIVDIIDELFEDEYELNNPEFLELVESYGTNRDDAKLKDIVLKLYRYIQSKPDPLAWLREVTGYYKVSDENFMDNIWMSSLVEETRLELLNLKELVDHNIDLCQHDGGPLEYLSAVKSDYYILEDLLESIDKDYDIFTKNLSLIEHEKLKRISKKRQVPIDDVLVDRVKSARDSLKKPLKKMQSSLSSKDTATMINQLNEMEALMNYLCTLVEKFTMKYRKEKTKKGILDFNDLEHYAIELLSDKDISGKYREKFKYIFLDEYQDSNIVQETIINHIKRDNNVFLVGDVKQSIYKFRLADPTLFIDKYNKYSKTPDAINYRINLSKNFRSRREVLDGINFIFKNIMSTKLGEIEYDESAFLYSGTHFEENFNSAVEINILDKSSEDEEIDDELKNLETVELEAIAISKKIKSLIGKKSYDGKTKTYKDLEYRDIVILLRATRSWSHVFTDVFMDEGIPLFSDSGSGFFDVLEIKVFLSLLNIIDNKFQDIPLITVLRSPIAGFTIEELINIRCINPKVSFNECYFSYNEEDQLGVKINDFKEKLDKWIHESTFIRLDELIWKLLMESGFYYYAGGLPGGVERQGNLKILVDKAQMFENTSISGLFNFIKFIEKLEKTSGDMDTAKNVSESENVVRLMSIHKSKGLEFPVVILAGAGKKFNLMDLNSELLLDKDLGFGLKYVDYKNRYYMETLPQSAIKSKMKAAVLSEELRILYVALTRAVDKLIIFGSLTKVETAVKKWEKKITPFNLLNCACYLDWIMSVAIRHKDLESFRNEYTLEIDLIDDDLDTKFEANILTRTELLSNLQEEKNTLADYKKVIVGKEDMQDIVISESLKSKFEYRYKHENAMNFPSKVSVTELKKLSNNNEDLSAKMSIPELKPPVVFTHQSDEDRVLSGAELGSAYHLVLAHLDYNLEKSITVNRTIDSLVDRRLIDKEVARVLDLKKLQAFVESDLFDRISKSKKVFREEAFVIKMEVKGESVLVQGIIDLYFVEDDKLVLVDYKSDKITKSLTHYKSIYQAQIKLYEEALTKMSRYDVKESLLYFMDVDKLVSV
ncbi:MAG: helicase-exonuclease AddAB subunit AddA [Acidaminobacteraceae bacterium]